jgi:hypothetical protein
MGCRHRCDGDLRCDGTCCQASLAPWYGYWAETEQIPTDASLIEATPRFRSTAVADGECEKVEVSKRKMGG